MHARKLVHALIVLAAFGAGVGAQEVLTLARAAGAPSLPVMLNVADVKQSEMVVRIPGTAAEKVLGTSDAVLLKVQMGAPNRHYHTESDEIQYVVEGAGSAWFVDQMVSVKPGDLLFIPRGIQHGGFTAGVKVLTMQMPPLQGGKTVNLQ